MGIADKLKRAAAPAPEAAPPAAPGRPKFCSECGGRLAGAPKFCPECGTAVA